MTNNKQDTASDIEQVLGADKQSSRKHLRFWIGGLILLIVIAIVSFYLSSGNGNTIQYKTAEVQQGDLTVTVTATGVLEPVNQVDVGTEISGTVEKVNVDYNDRVKVGQVLAVLDTDQLEAKYRQSQAALELAQAKVKEVEATVIETKNKLRRSRELATKGLCTPEECDAAQAAYARADASLASTKAQVIQAKAQLDAERTALAKAQIHSPINGIVLKRQIEPGQTVAASLQTPVLFTLAENLAQMELHVAVDEADVGQVEEGQKATFTVDAYPDRSFPAVITQVRFAPQTVEGVVTYETILSVDNTDLSLRPGMTATADIIVKQLKNAILVPNVALRFSPPTPKAQQADRRGLVASLLPRRPRSSSEEKRKNMSNNRGLQRVWILRDSQPLAVPVKTGASDGQMTEIVKGDIKPDMQVLVDTITTGK